MDSPSPHPHLPNVLPTLAKGFKALIYGTNFYARGDSPTTFEALFPELAIEWVDQPTESFADKCKNADVIFYSTRLTSDKIFRVIKEMKKPYVRAIAVGSTVAEITKTVQDFYSNPYLNPTAPFVTHNFSGR